jgi:hypothetical protein
VPQGNPLAAVSPSADNSRPSASPLDDAFRRQPQNHVAVALAGAAHGPEAVDHGRVKPDAAFAPARRVPSRRPPSRVAASASNAVGLIEMRIMGII